MNAVVDSLTWANYVLEAEGVPFRVVPLEMYAGVRVHEREGNTPTDRVIGYETLVALRRTDEKNAPDAARLLRVLVNPPIRVTP